MISEQALTVFGGTVATELLEVTRNPEDMRMGWWAVIQTFEGEFFGFRFVPPHPGVDINRYVLEHSSSGLMESDWTSNLDQAQYEAGVESIREEIARGWVYQTNFCRILSQDIGNDFDFINLYRQLSVQNPAPYAALFQLPKSITGLDLDINVASASPELFLKRSGDILLSSPIKGTAKTADQMLEKDSAENIMIVDLIRNDLSQIATSGSVSVPEMLRLEAHPGLVHLVSDVTGKLNPSTTWAEILRAMCPPGSVSGAPKSSSLELISRLEPDPREIYCGTIGWIDIDNDQAELAVAIRTFWQSLSSTKPKLCFGTGAGITYGSDPQGEWLETELKARHLLKAASS